MKPYHSAKKLETHRDNKMLTGFIIAIWFSSVLLERSLNVPYTRIKQFRTSNTLTRYQYILLSEDYENKMYGEIEWVGDAFIALCGDSYAPC